MEGEGKEEKLPPGWRFHPTDEELITYYLISKINDSNFTARAVGDVDLNKNEPWDLPGKAKMGEKVWYFFSLRDRKYPTGVRTNRATNTGYWKTTGKDKEIYDVGMSSEPIGMKKTLVFYRGRAPRGEKTSWVMHEYRVHAKSLYRTAKQDEWVVCRVFQKSVGVKKYPSTHSRALNPYNLDIGSSAIASQMMMQQQQQQQQQQDAYQFPMGRNYLSHTEMEHWSRFYKGTNVATTGLVNFPFQTQFNYPINGGTSFSISGLNLNIRDGSTTQQVLQPDHPTGINPHDVLMTSSMMTNGVIENENANYTSIEDMNNTNAMGGRYVGLDQCVDLDNYWASYN